MQHNIAKAETTRRDFLKVAAGTSLATLHLHALGRRAGVFRLAERCANLCFGGPKNNRLYMTSCHSLYALYVEAHGAV